MSKKRMTSDGVKPKDFAGSIKRLIRYNKPYFKVIVFALFLSFGSSIFSIIGPDRLKDIANLIQGGLVSGIDLDKIKGITIVLAILFIFGFVFNYVQSILMVSVTNKFSFMMRNKISDKINKLPLSYFDRSSIGDVLSRVTNDVDTASQTLNQSVSTLVSAITMLIGSVFMMFITNYILALAAIFSSLFGFILMGFILKNSQKYFIAVQDSFGKLNGHIEEVFSSLNVVKVYNAKEEVDLEFDKFNMELLENGRKSQFYSGLMMPIMLFVGNFGYVAVCIVGAVLTMNGVISFGVIVAFMIYVRLFTQPLSEIAQSMTQLQSAVAAGERVFEFLDEVEQDDESYKKMYLTRSEVKGNIEFRNVSFGYDPSRAIIKDFSVKIKKGDRVAIVGPTGAGKTTLVNLLMRFYDVIDGDILIDGVSIKELTRENVHKLFVMVLQDTWVFEGTIKENIRYNQEDVTDDRIVEVCKMVGLNHFIETLPLGYDTVIKDDDSLSSGQRRLLTIARCILEDGPFLILDEATSNVDTRTEVIVNEAMDKLTKGRTSFIIAHRLSTIKNADLILVLDNGNIVEQGDHETLLKKNGVYSELYNSQFNNIGI